MVKDSQLFSSIARRAARWLLGIFYGVVAAAMAGALAFMVGRMALSFVGSTAASRAVIGWLIFALAVAAGVLTARSYLRSSSEQRGASDA